MSEPKVSIVIPTFNRAWILPRAIDSILAQDYKDFEIIVADDCSSDNTAEVMDQYRSDERVIYKRNAVNVGKGNANRNVLEAIPLMRAKWGVFMGDDDYFGHPQCLSAAMNTLEDNPDCQVVFTRLMNEYGYSLKFTTGFDGDDKERIFTCGEKEIADIRNKYLVGFVWDRDCFTKLMADSSYYESNFEDAIFRKKVAYSPDVSYVLGFTENTTNQVIGAEIDKYFEARVMRVVSYFNSMVENGADPEVLRESARDKIKRDLTRPHTTAFVDFAEADFEELAVLADLFCDGLGKEFAFELGELISGVLKKRYSDKQNGLKVLRQIYKPAAEKEKLLKSSSVVAIYGTTDFAKQACEQIRPHVQKVVFVDDFYGERTFAGREVISSDELSGDVDTYYLCSALPSTIRKMAENLLAKGVAAGKIVSMV